MHAIEWFDSIPRRWAGAGASFAASILLLFGGTVLTSRAGPALSLQAVISFAIGFVLAIIWAAIISYTAGLIAKNRLYEISLDGWHLVQKAIVRRWMTGSGWFAVLVTISIFAFDLAPDSSRDSISGFMETFYCAIFVLLMMTYIFSLIEKDRLTKAMALDDGAPALETCAE